MGRQESTEVIVHGNGNNVAARADGKVTINGKEYDTPAEAADDTGNVVVVRRRRP